MQNKVKRNIAIVIVLTCQSFEKNGEELNLLFTFWKQ